MRLKHLEPATIDHDGAYPIWGIDDYMPTP